MKRSMDMCMQNAKIATHYPGAPAHTTFGSRVMPVSALGWKIWGLTER